MASWTNAEKHKPNHNREVDVAYVFNERAYVEVGYYEGGVWHHDNAVEFWDATIQFWKPRPEPPKMEGVKP